MSSVKCKISKYLILSPYLSQSISCAKRLKSRENVKVTGAYLQDEEYLYQKNILKYYDALIVINSITHDIFKEYNFVIPTGALSTKLVFDYCNKINLRTINFEKDSLISSDKLLILSLAQSLDIGIPETWKSFIDIPPNTSVFYKPKYEGLPGNRSWASSRDQLPESVKNDNYIYQEKIESPGVYGYGFIADNGKVLTSFSHFEIVSQPINGGSAAVIKPYKNVLLDKYSNRLIKEINYTGWGLVEYKWCPIRKDFVLMEINAKMWASIELAFMLNPEFCSLILSTETSICNVKGLVWMDRLIRNGIYSLWNSRKYIINYKCIYEPINYSRYLCKTIDLIVDKTKNNFKCKY